MAASSPPGTPTATTPVIGLTQPTIFAGQSQSRLMTLPKELRNKIYEFVLCDNSTYTNEPVAYEFVPTAAQSFDGVQFSSVVAEAKMALVPHSVRLDHTMPPSKDCILPCRMLHSEMKQMYVAAYRSYWMANRFLYSAAEMSDESTLPIDADMARIQEFHIVLHRKCYLRVVFDGINWDFWLLPVDGTIQTVTRLAPAWSIASIDVENAVIDYLLEMPSSGFGIDPRAGQGLTRDMVATVSRLADLDIGLQMLLDHDSL